MRKKLDFLGVFVPQDRIRLHKKKKRIRLQFQGSHESRRRQEERGQTPAKGTSYNAQWLEVTFQYTHQPLNSLVSCLPLAGAERGGIYSSAPCRDLVLLLCC